MSGLIGVCLWLKIPQKWLHCMSIMCSIRPSPRFSGLAARNKNHNVKSKFESLIKYLNKLSKMNFGFIS